MNAGQPQVPPSHSLTCFDLLQLLHALSINLGPSPDVRTDLSDSQLFSAFKQRLQTGTPHTSAAVSQLLADWTFMFRCATPAHCC